MSVDLKLNANFDLDLTNAELNYVEGVYQQAQGLKTGLQTNNGEWFENTTAGLPYTDRILTVKDSRAVADASIQTYIKNYPNITGILEYNSVLDPTTRVYEVNFIASSSEFDETIQIILEV